MEIFNKTKDYFNKAIDFVKDYFNKAIDFAEDNYGYFVIGGCIVIGWCLHVLYAWIF